MVPICVVALIATALFVPAIGAQESAATPPGGQPHLAIPATFVRRVSNDDGYVVVGFATANDSVGKEWMLLEVGLTVQKDVKATLHRDDFTLITPDGKEIPLASQKEYNQAGGAVRSLNARANIQRQSLNYLPKAARYLCRVGFFSDTAQRSPTLTYDSVSLDWRHACFGRLFFHVPGGIQYGQYFLQVRFPNSVIRVPFRIMTKEDVKKAKEELERLKKQAKEQSKKNGNQ